MIITAWILFVFFGFISAIYTLTTFFTSTLFTRTAIVIWFFSVFVTALSAGVIWGGLFQ